MREGSLFFAAVLLIAPALFAFFSTPHKFPDKEHPDAIAPAAPVILFIVTSALMVGAVVGQLLTVRFAMDEILYRGYLSCGTFVFFELLLAAAGIGAFVAAIAAVPAYFAQNGVTAKKEVVQKLRSLKEKVSSQGRGAELTSAQNTLNDQDIDLINHLIAREQVPPKWTMF